jgi:hypothetical protein
MKNNLEAVRERSVLLEIKPLLKRVEALKPIGDITSVTLTALDFQFDPHKGRPFAVHVERGPVRVVVNRAPVALVVAAVIIVVVVVLPAERTATRALPLPFVKPHATMTALSQIEPMGAVVTVRAFVSARLTKMPRVVENLAGLTQERTSRIPTALALHEADPTALMDFAQVAPLVGDFASDTLSKTFSALKAHQNHPSVR